MSARISKVFLGEIARDCLGEISTQISVKISYYILRIVCGGKTIEILVTIPGETPG